MPDPLSSPTAYQAFIYTLPECFPRIRRSTLVYIPSGTLFGRVEGMLVFERDIILCVREFLDTDLCLPKVAIAILRRKRSDMLTQ
jgi:hypothetical protein